MTDTDRAALLRELADLAERCEGHLTVQELRRMAVDALTAAPAAPVTEPTDTDRPFADEPTEVLQTSLDLASTHARQAARFRPEAPGDELPAVVGLFRNELQHRGEL
jgi:hypothetical protein